MEENSKKEYKMMSDADTVSIFDPVATREESKDKVERIAEAVGAHQEVQPVHLSKTEYADLMKRMRTKPIVRTRTAPGRNEPCPCGSGKKFKHCCMGNGNYDNVYEEVA